MNEQTVKKQKQKFSNMVDNYVIFNDDTYAHIRGHLLLLQSTRHRLLEENGCIFSTCNLRFFSNKYND